MNDWWIWCARSIAALALALPTSAHADCYVPEGGIPPDVVAAIDVGHVRKELADMGIGVGGLYVSESFGNPSGGIKQGATYDGVLWLYLNGDLKKMGLWKGLCFYADSYQIHGRSITATDIGGLMTVSNYEADPATRLSELWLEQTFFDKRVAVRFGQLAADTEFLINRGASSLLDATFGWPPLADADLPGGGPAYPLATPGVRLAITPNDQLKLMIAVFNGDPADPNCTANPQVCNNNGLDFSLNSPPLLIAEGSYKYNQDELAGTIKLGGWNHFGNFRDQRFDAGGLPFAATGLSGRVIHGDYALYAVVDQPVWRMPGRDAKGVDLFGRVVGAPTDQHIVDFYADGGVNFSGVVPHRPDDSLAMGFAYAGISSGAHGFDLDSGLPVARTFEALLEICYTLQLNSGWTLQPDFQQIWRPGGSVPNDAGGTVGNATAVGVRTTLNF